MDRPKIIPCKDCDGTMKWFLGKYICGKCGTTSIPVEKEFVEEFEEFHERLKNGRAE